MTDFKIITINKHRSTEIGFRVQNQDGQIMVTYVSPEGAAYNCGLRCGDIVYSINGENVDFSADEFPEKIYEIKDDIILKVLSNVSLDGQRQSNSNISTVSGQNSNSSSQKITASMSSVDLNCSSAPGRHIPDVNYVPDEHIDSYLQPVSPTESSFKFCYRSTDGLDKSIGTSRDFDEDIANLPQTQITRKQAYKKFPSDVGVSEAPRISVKRAQKTTSFQVKDPVYTIKKRTNNVILAATTLAQKSSRYQTAPVSTSTYPVMSSSTSSTQLSSQALSNIVNESLSSSMSLHQISEPLNYSSPLMSDSTVQDDLSKLDVHQIEVEVKISSFKGKMARKSTWRRFVIEKDALGVIFNSLERDEANVACNSTAIDPYISGLGLYMNLWHSNNTMSRFFLPIGQQPFCDDIEINTSSPDIIQIKYTKHEVDFQINLSRMSEDKCNQLYNLFGIKMDVPDMKPLQTKKNRPHGSMDMMKPIDSRKQKIKYLPETPRNCSLSNLPQTALVDNVPLLVVVCVSVVEKLGIKMEGIYRKPGNGLIRKKMEENLGVEGPEKWSEYEEWTNVHTICSLLKSALRSFGLIDKDTAIKLSMINLTCIDRSNQGQVYMDMIYHLRQRLCKTDTSRVDQGKDPRLSMEILYRRYTFKYVLKHLNKVSQCHISNQMNAENLATCFSPTLFEDIPCDENGEYQTSKKSEADKNLKQMLTFWIKYADLLCELLEEDDDNQRYNKMILFSEDKYNPSIEETLEETDLDDEGTDVRELIEYYTNKSFVPVVESGNVIQEPGVAPLPSSSSDLSTFTKLKNIGAYRSYKVPKSENLPRRGSNSLSPQETRRKVSTAEVSLSPGSQKKIDSWASRSFRVKKRGEMLPVKKDLPLISMRLSGSTMDVPLVVDVCVSIIDKHGLDLDGIYRVSGKKQDINALEELVVANKDLGWQNPPFLAMWSNMYVVSCLLKSVLKRLCLIKKETWVHMSSQFSDKMTDNDVTKVLMASAYHLRYKKKKKNKEMIPENIDRLEKEYEADIRSATLRYVLRHLNTVSRHVHNNRMTSNSLAVCFVPVLMEEDASPSANIMTNNNKGIQILEKLIDHCDWIFQWDDRPWEDMYGKVMTDSLEVYLKNYSAEKTSQKTSSMDDDEIFPEHIVECQVIQELLSRFITLSLSLAQNRLTLRRHSDGTDGPVKKTDFDHDEDNAEGILDDNFFVEPVISNTMNNNCSRSLQNTNLIQ